MSEKRHTLDIHPNGRNKQETFTFTDFRCPHCSGHGVFTDEIGRNEQVITNCPFCDGTGKIMCSILVKWIPQYE